MRIVQILAVVVTLVLSIGAVAAFVPRWDMFAVSKPQPKDLLPPDYPAANQDSETESADSESPETNDKDHYSKNPFELSRTGSLPKAVAPEMLHSFGRMALGTTGEHDFLVRNEGTSPLQIAKGPTQCKCTLAGLKVQEIPPGGETMVHLQWTPKDEGTFEQAAVIWTNDPHQPRLEFRVEGLMYPEIVVVPSTGWSFGSIAKGGTVEFEGTVYSSLSEDFQITSVETSTENLTVTIEPMSNRHKESSDAKSGFTLKGTLKGGTKAGHILETVTLHTNSEKRPTIELNISAVCSGPMLIIGPDWYAGSHLLKMGPVNQTKGGSRKLTLMLEPGDEPLEFVEAKVFPGFLKVQIQPEKVGKDQPRERYSLMITVPENAPKGAFVGPNVAHIEAKTNHPSIESFRMDIEFEVR